MESGTSKTKIRIAALLLDVAILPVYAADHERVPGSGMTFMDYDSNKDGYLSLNEFKAKGKDVLAFKAADINGDERLDPSEFDKYLSRKASEQPKPASKSTGQPKPAQPETGY